MLTTETVLKREDNNEKMDRKHFFRSIEIALKNKEQRQ